MEGFLKAAAQLYKELFPLSPKLPDEAALPNKRALTPCLPETDSEAETVEVIDVRSGATPRAITWATMEIGVGVTPR